MQRRLIRWRRLFISPISGTKPPRRKSRSRLIDHSRLETLEVRQLLSATLSGTSDTQQFDNLSVDQLAMVEHV